MKTTYSSWKNSIKQRINYWKVSSRKPNIEMIQAERQNLRSVEEMENLPPLHEIKIFTHTDKPIKIITTDIEGKTNTYISSATPKTVRQIHEALADMLNRIPLAVKHLVELKEKVMKARRRYSTWGRRARSLNCISSNPPTFPRVFEVERVLEPVEVAQALRTSYKLWLRDKHDWYLDSTRNRTTFYADKGYDIVDIVIYNSKWYSKWTPEEQMSWEYEWIVNGKDDFTDVMQKKKKVNGKTKEIQIELLPEPKPEPERRSRLMSPWHEYNVRPRIVPNEDYSALRMEIPVPQEDPTTDRLWMPTNEIAEDCPSSEETRRSSPMPTLDRMNASTSSPDRGEIDEIEEQILREAQAEFDEYMRRIEEVRNARRTNLSEVSQAPVVGASPEFNSWYSRYIRNAEEIRALREASLQRGEYADQTQCAVAEPDCPVNGGNGND